MQQSQFDGWYWSYNKEARWRGACPLPMDSCQLREHYAAFCRGESTPQDAAEALHG